MSFGYRLALNGLLGFLGAAVAATILGGLWAFKLQPDDRDLVPVAGTMALLFTLGLGMLAYRNEARFLETTRLSMYGVAGLSGLVAILGPEHIRPWGTFGMLPVAAIVGVWCILLQAWRERVEKAAVAVYELLPDELRAWVEANPKVKWTQLDPMNWVARDATPGGLSYTATNLQIALERLRIIMGERNE
jgi:hypothetical protein